MPLWAPSRLKAANYHFEDAVYGALQDADEGYSDHYVEDVEKHIAFIRHLGLAAMNAELR